MLNCNKRYFRYAQKMQLILLKLCEPFFKSTPIRAFTYYRQLSINRFIVFSTDESWLKLSLSKNNWLHMPWLQNDLAQASDEGLHCRIWPDDKKDNMLQTMREQNLAHGLNLYRQSAQGDTDMWSFASDTAQQNLSMYYANNIDIFKIFSNVITHSCQHFLQEPLCAYANYHGNTLPKQSHAHALMKHFIRNTPLKSFPIMHQGKEYYLTHIEAICLNGISHGKTAKMIGRNTSLSYRTVEKHIERLKQKLDMHCRSKLILLYKHSRDSWL